MIACRGNGYTMLAFCTMSFTLLSYRPNCCIIGFSLYKGVVCLSTRIDICDYCDDVKEVTPNGFAGVDEGEGTTTLICQDCLENKIEEYKNMLNEFDQTK